MSVGYEAAHQQLLRANKVHMQIIKDQNNRRRKHHNNLISHAIHSSHSASNAVLQIDRPNRPKGIKAAHIPWIFSPSPSF